MEWEVGMHATLWESCPQGPGLLGSTRHPLAADLLWLRAAAPPGAGGRELWRRESVPWEPQCKLQDSGRRRRTEAEDGGGQSGGARQGGRVHDGRREPKGGAGGRG